MDEQAAGGTRVVLLARPGQGCERLREALLQAGAEVVLVADPIVADYEQVIAAAPQALLIALDPSVEEALDRFEAVLVDPQVTVIFDEAELAAQRTGWDSARWVRHLAAKLNRHQNVLPPGGEAEAEWHPSPGRIEQPPVQASELDIAAFAGEALLRADDLPSDSGLYVTPLSLTDDLNFDENEASAGATGDARLHRDLEIDLDEPGFDTAIDSVALESVASDNANGDEIAFDDVAFEKVVFENVVFENGALENGTVENAVPENAVPENAVLQNAALEDVTLESVALENIALEDAALQNVAFDIIEFDTAYAAAEAPADSGTRGPNPAFVRDLDELDRRVSSIELADVGSYGHGRKAQRGAVLVEAGLGGPDAVRQLLGELPEGFPQPVLVRLRLDGGRYDRLVKQMERATKLKVSLAKSGAVAEPGHVYFMAPELGLVEENAKLKFSDAVASSSLFTALPASESAVLFLSGSDPALVDVVMSQAWAGALIAGQGPEGCYDAMASTEVIARGGASGSPAELAGQLAERWPS